jgi:galactose mutarotase-like enzyme
MLDLFRRKPTTAEATLEDYGFAELRGGGSRVRVIPALGGRLIDLELAGRQWLWTNHHIPFAPPTVGASYVETADSGGYDECFPTVGQCRLPSWVKAFGGFEIPEHGELWSQTPTVNVEPYEGTQAIVSTWGGTKIPYAFTRRILVTADGAVVMDYAVRNDGKERMPFVWSSYPLFALTPQTHLILPEGSRLRVYGSQGVALGTTRTEHKWPYVRTGALQADLSHPANVAKRYACKLFLDMPQSQGRAAIREGLDQLEVTFDPRQVPNVGLWINRNSWTPLKRGDAYCNISLAPCVGAPDTLTEALGDWKGAHWVEPGGVKEWRLTWRGRRLIGEADTPSRGSPTIEQEGGQA